MGIEKVIRDTVSCDNCVVRMHLTGSTYRTALHVLDTRNVALFPIDCMTPPKDSHHDLRLTTGVAPRVLLAGTQAAFEEMEDLHAAESAERWLQEEDHLVLRRVGLHGLLPGRSCWGTTRQICQRAGEISDLLGVGDRHKVERLAALSRIGEVWRLFDLDEAVQRWKELFGFKPPIDLPNWSQRGAWLCTEGISILGVKYPKDIRDLAFEYFADWEGFSLVHRYLATIVYVATECAHTRLAEGADARWIYAQAEEAERRSTDLTRDLRSIGVATVDEVRVLIEAQ